MTNLLFCTFVLLLGFGLAKLCSHPEKIYEYPQFMSAVFAAFILPQFVSLLRFPGAAPEETIKRVFAMGCLCLAACLAGYCCLRARPTAARITGSINEKKLHFVGLLFVGLGLLFTYILCRTEVQTDEFGGWTGPATIYGFFQQLCYPGFAICLLIALRTPSSFTIASAVVAAAIPLQSIIIGRREPAALFALTVGLTLYFQLRLRPPRWLVATGILAAILAIPATGAYRRFQLEGDWNGVRDFDFINNFQEYLNEESVLEVRNAAMLIEATQRSGQFEFGAGYWNHLVFRYVPAQLLGKEFKQSLMIARPRDGLEAELAAMAYVNPAGSTVTGLGDTFQQFGWFGSLFFGLLALLFQRLWRAAMIPHAWFAQLLYIQSCTSAMRAVTHWTLDFLPGFFYSLLFLGFAFWYAREPNAGALDLGDRRRISTPKASPTRCAATKDKRNVWSPLPPGSERTPHWRLPYCVHLASGRWKDDHFWPCDIRTSSRITRGSEADNEQLR